MNTDDDWYALILATQNDDRIEAVAEWVEPRRKLFLASTSTDVIKSDGGDVATEMMRKGFHRTAVVYHPEPQSHPEAAWAGVMLPKDPGSSTWKFKRLTGITPTGIRPGDQITLNSKRCNYYVTIAGVPITREGVASSGRFLDVTRGIDWLHARMQEKIFSLLADSDKVPLTDAGISVVENTIRGVLGRAVEKDLLDGDSITVSMPEVMNIDSEDRKARTLPDVAFRARLAGAIHRVEINGSVTV